MNLNNIVYKVNEEMVTIHKDIAELHNSPLEYIPTNHWTSLDELTNVENVPEFLLDLGMLINHGLVDTNEIA